MTLTRSRQLNGCGFPARHQAPSGCIAPSFRFSGMGHSTFRSSARRSAFRARHQESKRLQLRRQGRCFGAGEFRIPWMLLRFGLASYALHVSRQTSSVWVHYDLSLSNSVGAGLDARQSSMVSKTYMRRESLHEGAGLDARQPSMASCQLDAICLGIGIQTEHYAPPLIRLTSPVALTPAACSMAVVAVLTDARTGSMLSRA